MAVTERFPKPNVPGTINAMSTPEAYPGQHARAVRRKVWVEDVRWHRETYQESRFKWWDIDVMKIVTANTGGKLDFTTLHDLRVLQQWRVELCTFATSVRRGMAPPLREAYRVWNDWEPIADEVGMTPLECAETIYIDDGFPAEQNPPPHPVVRINTSVAGMVFGNPLIHIVEMKQMWRMYTAAVDMHDDTICDLTEELSGTHSAHDIARAAGMSHAVGFGYRFDEVRQARGGPGDPRRIPTQESDLLLEPPLPARQQTPATAATE